MVLLVFQISRTLAQSNLTYPVVDTKQATFYNNSVEINEPAAGEVFYGQDPVIRQWTKLPRQWRWNSKPWGVVWALSYISIFILNSPYVCNERCISFCPLFNLAGKN